MFRDPTCSTFRKILIASVFGVGGCLIPHGVQSAPNNSATLQWAANQESDLAGYRVYHGTIPGNYGSSQDVGKTTTYQYASLESNKTHFFAVTAYDASGNESSPSTEVFKAIAEPKTSLSVSITGSGTVSSNPAGISCTSGACTGTFLEGSKITLTANPKSGNTFSGWGGACTGTGSCVVALSSSSASVSASFVVAPPLSSSLNVTLAGGGSGIVTGGVTCSSGTCSGTFSQGTSVTLTAAPSGGSTFSGWSGACTGHGSCVVALSTSSASVSANFAPSPPPSSSLSVTLTGDGKGSVLSNPSGLTCSGGTCTGSFPQGTNVTLTPATQSGSLFQGWNGVCSGTSHCAVTLSSSKVVTATFVTEKSDPSPPTPNFPVLINFQPPNSQIPTNFQKDDGSVFSSARGYGWNQLVIGTDQNSIAEQSLDTFVSASNQSPATWNFSIPNGAYYVTMVLGDPDQAQGPHWVSIEDLQLAKQVKTAKGEYLTIVDYSVEVKDSTLSLTLGNSGQGQTTLNYLVVNEQPNLSNTTQILTKSFGTTLISSVLNPGIATKINPVVLVKNDKDEKEFKEKELAQKKKEEDAAAVAQAQVKKQKEQDAAAVAQAQVKKQKEQDAAAVAQAQVKKQKEQEAAAVVQAQAKKQKAHEVATLNEIKENIVAKRNSGGTVSLRSLFGK